VEDLDRRIALPEGDAERIAWKTASNAWVLVSKMFKDAAGAKQRDLRVRSDNPAAGVAPPEHGDRKAKVYLYPSEFETLVGCAGIDLRFLTVYAVAVYTYMRAGELEALTRDDVDLEHGVIQINKAIDRETGRVKSTKSGETRRIPIEPNIAPLLERLCHGRSGEQPVLWMPDNEDRAVMLRQHLEQAGVKRADLFADNDRQKHVTFHDLRATGITWMAVRGDDPLRIKQRAGHSSFSTTEMYIREVENLVAGFGAPFPSLPKELVGRSANRPGIVRNERSPRNDKWSNGGSNTHPRTRQASPIVAKTTRSRRRKTTPDDARFRLRATSWKWPSPERYRPRWTSACLAGKDASGCWRPSCRRGGTRGKAWPLSRHGQAGAASDATQSRPLPRRRPIGLAKATSSGPTAAQTSDTMPLPRSAPESRDDVTRWTRKYKMPITPTRVTSVPSSRITRMPTFWWTFTVANLTGEPASR
jgi:integrase